MKVADVRPLLAALIQTPSIAAEFIPNDPEPAEISTLAGSIVLKLEKKWGFLSDRDFTSSPLSSAGERMKQGVLSLVQVGA